MVTGSGPHRFTLAILEATATFMVIAVISTTTPRILKTFKTTAVITPFAVCFGAARSGNDPGEANTRPDTLKIVAIA